MDCLGFAVWIAMDVRCLWWGWFSRLLLLVQIGRGGSSFDLVLVLFMFVGLGGRDYCCFVGGLDASGCLDLCLFRCVGFSVLRWMCCCVVWIWLFLLLVLLTVDGLICLRGVLGLLLVVVLIMLWFEF